jgi:hypothetical protein
MTPRILLLAFVALAPVPAHAFDPGDWLKRCFAASDAVNSASSLVIETKCNRVPVDICLYESDPSLCMLRYRKAMRAEYRLLYDALPNPVESPKLRDKFLNDMLREIKGGSDDSCTPSWRKEFESEQSGLPSWMSVDQACAMLNEISNLSKARAARRSLAELPLDE